MPSDISNPPLFGADTSAPNVVAAPEAGQDEQDKMFDFAAARIHLERIIGDWSAELEDTDVRRRTRKVEIDVESLRQKGELDEDETIVPVRTIDTNIQREQPPYINYIKNSRRICIFDSVDRPNMDCDQIELAFTKKATYKGWETPFFKVIDGAQVHGWDAVEVVFDEDKPGNFAIEHIGHDRLLFPRSAIDIQQSPRIIRSYDVTFLQLKKWVLKYGFDAEQVNTVLAARKETQKENETERIYKCFYKKDGIVYVAWFCLAYGVSDWLKKPIKHSVGVKFNGTDVDETQYPVFILNYRETEEPKIIDHKGRVFLDEPKQEAQTAILSGFINGLTRASNIYASPATEDGTGSALSEITDVVLRGGRILNKPLNFWAPPYPDALVLRVLEYMANSNSDETNQVNFAAINREDSRKTATEISAAQGQQQLLNSVQLTLFSTFIRSVYSFAWRIVQSVAIEGTIKFLLIEQQQPQINPLTGQPIIDPATGQPITQSIWVNDVATISLKYDIRAAGDVDVILKQELEAKFQQDWSVISQTVLKDRFLSDYIKLRYPAAGEQYAAILMQGAQMPQMIGLIGGLSTVLSGFIKDSPEAINNLPPEQIEQLTAMIQQSQQVVQQAQQTESKQA